MSARCEHFYGNSGCYAEPWGRCSEQASLAILDEHGKTCGSYCSEHGPTVYGKLQNDVPQWDGPGKWRLVLLAQWSQ